MISAINCSQSLYQVTNKRILSSNNDQIKASTVSHPQNVNFKSFKKDGIVGPGVFARVFGGCTVISALAGYSLESWTVAAIGVGLSAIIGWVAAIERAAKVYETDAPESMFGGK